MTVYCKKHPYFTCTMTTAVMDTMLVNAALYKAANNRHYAIITQNNEPVHDVNCIITTEEKDEPLWKQSMHLSMGQKPRKIRRDTQTYVMEIDREEAKMYKFTILLLVR